MRVGLLTIWALAGCYEHADPAAPAGEPGECAAWAEPDDLGPIAEDEIPGWVEGRSTLVEDGSVPRCVPDNPESDEQYGCRDDDGRCIPTPARARIVDDTMVVSLHPTCANEMLSDVPEFRMDGEPVAPNRVVWTVEVGIPVDAIDPGETIELWDTPCAYVTFRIRDWVNAEADSCGHDPLVIIQDDGLRTVWCRDEWRPFRADVGSDPGLLAHSRVTVSSAELSEGGTFRLSVNVGGCGATDLALVTDDGSPIPMICCSDLAQRSLESTIGAGGMLPDLVAPMSSGFCCYDPTPDPNVAISTGCGEGDPGTW